MGRLVHGFPEVKKILIGEDLNRHVNTKARQFAGTNSNFGFECLNK